MILVFHLIKKMNEFMNEYKELPDDYPEEVLPQEYKDFLYSIEEKTEDNEELECCF